MSNRFRINYKSPASIMEQAQSLGYRYNLHYLTLMQMDKNYCDALLLHKLIETYEWEAIIKKIDMRVQEHLREEDKE